MKSIKKLLSFALCAAVTAALTGCGSGDSAVTAAESTTAAKSAATAETGSTDGIAAPAETTAAKTGAAGNYVPGTYKAAAPGKNGDVEVEVVFSGDVIESVLVVDHKETEGICETPIERIPAQVVEYQSLAVDAISGATVTSDAILAAVADCVAQAGGDVETLKNKSVEKADSGEVVEKTADIVIIGGGGAGLSAAVAASENGASVIVIEKTAAVGGNTILAGGGYNAYDPERQGNEEMNPVQLETIEKLLEKEPLNDTHKMLMDKVKEQLDEYKNSGSAKLFDSVEYHALQTYDGGDYLADPELVLAMCMRASDMLGQLEDYGLVWKDKVTTYVGALWMRSHEAKDYKSGKGFIDTFVNVIEENSYPVEILLETEGTELMVTDGAVTGVKAAGTDGTEYVLTANKGVILASGGFAANNEMCMKYKPSLLPTLKSTNSAAITGDGIVMAEAVGAALVDMDQIQLLPTSSPFTGSSPGYVGESAGMYINLEGKRFVNEYMRRDELTAAALAQSEGMFYIVTCEKNAIIDENGRNKFGEKVEDLIETKQVFKGDTVEELAEQIGVSPEVLQETFDKWQEACHTGVDGEFGRTSFAENVWLDEGPFYASIRTPAIHHTMGGVKVDADMHVIAEDGSVIPGLYAAGEVTGGIHGSNRLGANAVPDALSNGRVAGQNAADGK